MKKRSLTRFLVSGVFGANGVWIYLHFQGSDVLWLYENNVPGYSRLKLACYRWYIRRFLKLNHIYAFINSEKLRPYLEQFGFRKDRIELREVPWQKVKVKRIKHKGFNALFYLPERYTNTKYRNWIYGKEYLDQLRVLCPDVNWVVADSSLNMPETYKTIDCYVKINRCKHSDRNRISKECAYNNIPERAFDVWEKDFKIEEIVDWINSLNLK